MVTLVGSTRLPKVNNGLLHLGQEILTIVGFFFTILFFDLLSYLDNFFYDFIKCFINGFPGDL